MCWISEIKINRIWILGLDSREKKDKKTFFPWDFFILLLFFFVFGNASKMKIDGIFGDAQSFCHMGDGIFYTEDSFLVEYAD